MGNTFFTSDDHFWHANIIKYCDRPFDSVEEMNEALIANWNSVVGKNDVVWNLGDFAFFKNKETLRGLIARLNGTKNLILGNHDRLRPTEYIDLGFNWASRFPVIFDKFVILSHEPIFLEANSVFFNIYGHLHQNEYVEAAGYPRRHYSACVELRNYRPVSFEEIDTWHTQRE
jgi:calcineurin-like phosphoesterase family protein